MGWLLFCAGVIVGLVAHVVADWLAPRAETQRHEPSRPIPTCSLGMERPRGVMDLLKHEAKTYHANR